MLDVFTCLRHHTHLDAAGKWLSRNPARYLKGPAVMRRLFADLPEAVDNTLRLAERLEFSLENLGYTFPKHPVKDGETESSVLRRKTLAGAKRRYGKLTKAVKKQLRFLSKN